jgi:hypothetical protein
LDRVNPVRLNIEKATKNQQPPEHFNRAITCWMVTIQPRQSGRHSRAFLAGIHCFCPQWMPEKIFGHDG